MSRLRFSLRQPFLLNPRALYEPALVIALFCFAILVRTQNWMTVPPLTDEFKEVSWALDMNASGHVPLVAYDSYDGPLFTYLLAFLFRVLGPSILLPRLFVLIVGALTIVAVYYLGKTLARGDWRVGAIAALLLAANAHHILFNSHVAWSNDITPLFTTGALLAYVYATRYQRPVWLIAAGALYGLALQTHPTVLALAVGFPVDFLVRRETRALFRTQFPYLAVCAMLVALSPMLVFNLQNNFDSLRTASTAQYALATQPTLQTIWENIVPQTVALARVASGSFENLGLAASEPLAILFFVSVLMAMLWMARRGEPLPLIGCGCAFVFFIVFNHFTAMPDGARYFQIFLPLAFGALGQAGIWLWDKCQVLPWRGLARAALVLALVALVGSSLAALNQYYADALASGSNNIALLQMIETTRGPANTPLLLEWDLAKIRTGRGGNIADDLAYLARLDGRQVQLVSVTTPEALGGLQNYLRAHESAYLIGFTNTSKRLDEEFELQPLTSTRFPCVACPRNGEFGLYWWQAQ